MLNSMYSLLYYAICNMHVIINAIISSCKGTSYFMKKYKNV